MLFAGESYYPRGGMNDFIGRTATLVHAINLLHQLYRWDWFNIYDTEGDKIYNKYNNMARLTSDEQRLEWAEEEDREVW